MPNLLLEMFDLNLTSPLLVNQATQKVSLAPSVLFDEYLSPVIANYAEWLWVSCISETRTPPKTSKSESNHAYRTQTQSFSSVSLSNSPENYKVSFCPILLQYDDHFVAPVLINYVDWPLSTSDHKFQPFKPLLTLLFR